jgi:sporulation protein YlmC with PRC-barrel domain
MSRNLLIAASALALLAAPAQTGSPSPSTTAQATSKADPLKQEDVSQIKGAAVYGSDDKKIGSVSTVLMKPDSKAIDRLVVGAGGVLGVGARDVALPVDQFRWDAVKGGFKVSKTEDELKKMPEWKSASSTGASSGSSTPPASSSPPATGPSKP